MVFHWTMALLSNWSISSGPRMSRHVNVVSAHRTVREDHARRVGIGDLDARESFVGKGRGL